MKKLLALLLALVMVFGMIACGAEVNSPEVDDQEVTENKADDGTEADVGEEAPVEETPAVEEEEKEEEEDKIVEEEPEEEPEEEDDFDAQALAEEFVDCLFTPDVAGLFDMMPMDVMLAMLEEQGITEDLDAMIAELQAEAEAGYADFEGIDLDWNVSVTSEEVVDEEELEEINVIYSEIGVEVEKAIVVTAETTMMIMGTESETETLNLTFIMIDGIWYLDPNTTDVF